MVEAGIWQGGPGARGLIKYAYRTVAEVGEYQIALKTLTMAGVLVTSVPFLLTQTPLVFVVVGKRQSFRWPILSFTVTEGRAIHARLGPLIVEG